MIWTLFMEEPGINWLNEIIEIRILLIFFTQWRSGNKPETAIAVSNFPDRDLCLSQVFRRMFKAELSRQIVVGDK